MVLVVQGELHRARRNKREELQRVVRRRVSDSAESSAGYSAGSGAGRCGAGIASKK